MKRTGEIISADLTVFNVDEIKDFYKDVVGWKVMPLKMSDEEGLYQDYVLMDEDENWIAGICSKRGVNADMPSQWIIYVHVDSISDSIRKCLALGGKVLKVDKDQNGEVNYALIEDPAGACLALTKAGD